MHVCAYFEARSVNVNQLKNNVDEYKNMFESLISAGTIIQLLGWQSSLAEVTARYF